MTEDEEVKKDQEDEYIYSADQDNDIEPVKLEKPKKEKEMNKELNELLVIGFEKKPKGKNPLAMRSPDSRQAFITRGNSK